MRKELGRSSYYGQVSILGERQSGIMLIHCMLDEQCSCLRLYCMIGQDTLTTLKMPLSTPVERGIV